jgi:hypothetical protein
LFSLLTPFVFWAAGRWGWKTVIFSSLSIWLIGQLRVRGLLVTATKDLSYINPGPFDVLAWQFLWAVGLFCGQRLCEKKRALPLPKPLPVILILVSIAFFAWRLITVSAIAVPNNQAWLLDKWHLGPLRLLNFLVTGWTFSKVLGHLRCRQCRALSLWHHPWAQHRRVDCVSLAFIRFNLGMPRRKVATGINC